MISLDSEHRQFAALMEAHLTRGKLGLLYLDIARLDQFHEQYGNVYTDRMLLSLMQIVMAMREETEDILAYRRLGDDFFLYIDLTGVSPAYVESHLQERCKQIKLRIESRLQPHTGGRQLELVAGRALVEGDERADMDRILYRAMKQAIQAAKEELRTMEESEQSAEFYRILKEKAIRTVYQPIVSLLDADLLGYEALTRGPEGSVFRSPLELFAYAEKEQCLYQLENMAREKALEGSGSLYRDQKVFLNIQANIIHDPGFSPGTTQRILQQYGLHPGNVVFEITERSSIDDFTTVKKTLEHYRSQGYKIAIDDAGAGYSSLQAIAELQPDYIKIDRSLIQDIHQDKIKENIVETMVTFARKMDTKLIAEGIERPEELMKLIKMGIHYGQGYFIGQPQGQMYPLNPDVRSLIDRQKKIQTNWDSWAIGDLASPIHTFDEHTLVSVVFDYFRQHTEQLGAVVLRQRQPVGLIMREKLYQRLAEQYGVHLYWNRPIAKLMDRSPLLVEHSLSVEYVSQLAMARDLDRLYDFVIITRGGGMAGVASIRSILESITSSRMEKARVANPLTGLPGNVQIHRELTRRIKEREPFSVIYADLDYFKWYNDLFGFQKGDQLIQYTADVIQFSVGVFGQAQDFVGHIGGDDFIVVTGSPDAGRLCEEAIRRFDEGVGKYYEGYDWRHVEDRLGNRYESNGVTISLSLVICEYSEHLTPDMISQAAAVLKKKSKAHPGSVYYSKQLKADCCTV